VLSQHLLAHPLPRHELIDAAAMPNAGEPYGRLPIFRGTLGEVLLVRWAEETFCAPHDHGEASGFVVLLRGQFTERLWRWKEGALQPMIERAYAAPVTIEVRGGAIHDMKARGGGVGIHFYLPAIAGMKVYDRDRRETLVVRDDCGAWVPRDPALIEQRSAW
jgi:cysteine dioxygenase